MCSLKPGIVKYNILLESSQQTHFARKKSCANLFCGVAVSSVALAAKPCYPYINLESSLRSFRTVWLKTIWLKKLQVFTFHFMYCHVPSNAIKKRLKFFHKM